jgi:hypothetical protein
MRTLFIAVSRVFGLMQVYFGLAYITSMLPALAMIRRTTRGDVGEVFARSSSGAPVVLATGGMVATLVLTFGVAWLLLFRTEWLADKLAVPELDAQPPLSPESILQVGARLLGLYVVIQAGSALVGQLGYTISEIREIVGLSESVEVGFMERMILGRIWSGLVGPGLKLALGLLLVLKTDSVLKWIDTAKRKEAGDK